MVSMKAQADIISAIIIIVLALGLVGTAFLWAKPIIQKRQDTTLVERALKSFDRSNVNSITSKIESVARNEGEDTFTIDVDGLFVIHPSTEIGPENNSLQFSITSSVTNVAEGRDWVAISSGNTNPVGILGVDDPSVVFGRADTISGDLKNVTFKSWFRVLNDTSTNTGYKIALIKHEASPISSSAKNIRIIFDGREQLFDPQLRQNLITTKIKILLG